MHTAEIAHLPATARAEESATFTPLDPTHASLDAYDEEEGMANFGTSALELLPHEEESESSRVPHPGHMADRLV